MEIDFEKLNPGIFSVKDSRILFNIIAQGGIGYVLEIGGRTGRSTSIMVQARPDIKIDTFEMDPRYHEQLQAISPNVTVFSNVVDYPLDIDKYDFIFIDGNHDAILAKWYVEHILDKCTNQLIHIHDMPCKDNNLESLDIIQARITTGEVISRDRLIEIYGRKMYDEYKEDERSILDVWEGDIIVQFIKDNDISFYSTYDGGKDDAIRNISPPINNCSLYMWRN